MKATKKQIATMGEIMETIAQTREWLDIQERDPDIKHADKEYSKVLDKLTPFITCELEDELTTAVTMRLCALECAAILDLLRN